MSETRTERRQVEKAEWLVEGRSRFGDDPLDWQFQCVSCGHVQTGRAFMDRYGLTRDGAMSRAYFSCEGRMGLSEGGEAPGCDWSLGGLLWIHTLEVTGDGDPVPVFEFAEPAGP